MNIADYVYILVIVLGLGGCLFLSYKMRKRFRRLAPLHIPATRDDCHDCAGDCLPRPRRQG